MAQNFDTYNGKLTGELLDTGASVIKAKEYTEPASPNLFDIELDHNYNLHHASLTSNTLGVQLSASSPGTQDGYIRPVHLYIHNESGGDVVITTSGGVHWANPGIDITVQNLNTVILTGIYDGYRVYFNTEIFAPGDRRPVI